MLENVPDWLMGEQHGMMIIMMNLLSGTKAIKNVRPRKHKLKKLLMRISWHPSRWWDWYVPEDKKKRQKKFGS